MSDFGIKNSQRRNDWWETVIKPISIMAKTLKVGNYPSSKTQWLAATGPSYFGPTGSLETAYTRNAKAVADKLEITVLSTAHLVHNMTKSQAFVAELRAALPPAGLDAAAVAAPLMSQEEAASVALGGSNFDPYTSLPGQAALAQSIAVSPSATGSTDDIGMSTGIKVAIGVTSWRS